MTTWISHLRVAEGLLERLSDFDEEALAVGSVAPDSGIPNEDWTAFDPPASTTHFSGPDAEKRDIEDIRFYREYLPDGGSGGMTARQRSFLWGYFFHLVTDRLWSARVGRPTLAKFAKEFEADPKFINEVKRDWYGLDFDFVRSQPDCLYWRVFLAARFDEPLLPFLPKGALARNLAYIQGLYQRQDEEIEEWYVRRPNKYLLKDEMDLFVVETTDMLEQIYRALIGGVVRVTDAMSILELEPFATMVSQ